MEGAKKEAEALPPGFRFHPTDEELITSYLTPKISDSNFSAKAIADVDLNKCEPWDLPGKAKMGEKEWYFFSLKDRKYPTGVRTNRATNAGYWKTTGKDKEILNSQANSELVGMKKTLVFYRGRAPRGEKTNWVMHEYRLHSKPTFKAKKDEWVVCRVFMKSAGGKKYSSQPRATNPCAIDMAHAMMPLNHPVDPYYHLGMGSRAHQYLTPSEAGELARFGMGSRAHQYLTPSEAGELARFAKGQPGFNLPIQSPLNAFPGNFTLPGLNLNLGAQQQPGHRPMPMPMAPQQQQQMVPEPMNCMIGSDVGFGGDSCVDLDGYWPAY